MHFLLIDLNETLIDQICIPFLHQTDSAAHPLTFSSRTPIRTPTNSYSHAARTSLRSASSPSSVVPSRRRE